MFVCCTTPPRSFGFASRVSNFQVFIYDYTVDVVHGPVESVLFFLFIPILPCLRTIDLSFVVTYNCLQCYVNNYVRLLTTSCVFSSIVQSYVIQRNASLHVTIAANITLTFREIKPGSTKYQGIYIWTFPW